MTALNYTGIMEKCVYKKVLDGLTNCQFRLLKGRGYSRNLFFLMETSELNSFANCSINVCC